MKADDLLDVIGETEDHHLRDAKEYKKRPGGRHAPGPWKNALIHAACFLLIAGGVSWLVGNLGGNSGGDGASIPDGGSGGEERLTYMYYAGPVFPLTFLEDCSAVTAQRNVDFDFSHYSAQNISMPRHEGIITDSYTLTNQSDSDVTLTALYPYAGTMADDARYIPTLTVNGTAAQVQVCPGAYSGGWAGVYGAENEAQGDANLEPLTSFADYEALLDDESYLAGAFLPAPTLDQPVTVYRLSDYVYTQDESASNPTLNMEFYMDYDRTAILSYNMNGGTVSPETGFCSRHCSSIQYRPNLAEEFQHPPDSYIILLGEDIDGYTLQGYRDGGCDEGEELDDLSCTVTRYETTLGQVLSDVLAEADAPLTSDLLDRETHLELVARMLSDYGIVSIDPKARYEFGMLEDVIYESLGIPRVIYLSFELTVPAGESISVEASFIKTGSHDYYGEGTDRNGYDMATSLGSCLSFTQQTASLSGWEEVTLLHQNFGFDPEKGITSVVLDPAVTHYWLEIRKK